MFPALYIALIKRAIQTFFNYTWTRKKPSFILEIITWFQCYLLEIFKFFLTLPSGFILVWDKFKKCVSISPIPALNSKRLWSTGTSKQRPCKCKCTTINRSIQLWVKLSSLSCIRSWTDRPVGRRGLPGGRWRLAARSSAGCRTQRRSNLGPAASPPDVCPGNQSLRWPHSVYCSVRLKRFKYHKQQRVQTHSPCHALAHRSKTCSHNNNKRNLSQRVEKAKTIYKKSSVRLSHKDTNVAVLKKKRSDAGLIHASLKLIS